MVSGGSSCFSLSFNECILGLLTADLTVVKELFEAYDAVDRWQFKVIYNFDSMESSSVIDFRRNQCPSNGSCSIYLANQTTQLFTIHCLDWLDEDGIKDYSFSSKVLSVRLIFYLTSGI